MVFLEEKCVFEVLTQEVLLESNPFTCGNDADMDEFFQKDALTYARRRIGKTYCFRLEEDYRNIVACFTLSNDSIRIWDLGSSKNQGAYPHTTPLPTDEGEGEDITSQSLSNNYHQLRFINGFINGKNK